MKQKRIMNAADAAGAEALAPSRVSALLPAGVIQDDEIIILMLRPSLLFVPLSCLVSLIFFALIAFFLAYLSRLPWVGWNDTQAFALGIGLSALRLGWQMAEWYSRIYILTDRRVITRAGVFRVSTFQTELKNIQHTSIFNRVRERLFGLGTIGFATAGSDVFETFWVMIRQPFTVHKTILQATQRYTKR